MKVNGLEFVDSLRAILDETGMEVIVGGQINPDGLVLYRFGKDNMMDVLPSEDIDFGGMVNGDWPSSPASLPRQILDEANRRIFEFADGQNLPEKALLVVYGEDGSPTLMAKEDG